MNKKINVLLVLILTIGVHVFASSKFENNKTSSSKMFPLVLKDLNLNKDFSTAFGIKTPVNETNKLKLTSAAFEKSALLNTNFKIMSYNTNYNVVNLKNNFNNKVQVLDINNFGLNDITLANTFLIYTRKPLPANDFMSLKTFNDIASKKTDLPKINLNLSQRNENSDDYNTFLKVGKNLKGWGIGLLSLGLLYGLINLINVSDDLSLLNSDSGDLFYNQFTLLGVAFLSAPPIISGSLMLGFGHKYLNKARRIKPIN
ncbi:MAG: hypothetical protein QM539_05790 [Alphaproteobacteria bacterium]|nr:hypothetical protein [Alphaproteobacteria bacterium]